MTARRAGRLHRAAVFIALLMVAPVVRAESRSRPAEGPPRSRQQRSASFTDAAAQETLSELARESRGSTKAAVAAWLTYWTPNFRVLHRDRAAAEAVGLQAEQLRDQLLHRWTGERYPAPWLKRADLYLFPTTDEMNEMTGGEAKAGSTLVRPSQLYRGRILSRRVNVAQDDRQLRQATLPHEITHVILGDLLGGQIPLWANEGAAAAAEVGEKQDYYGQVLRRFLLRRQPYRLTDLLAMQSYPDGPFNALFYAQSCSLVRLLLRLGSYADFLGFVRYARSGGYDAAVQQVYGLAGLTALQRRWLAEQRARR
ncbi:MAG: hypothetical protein IPL40_07960 [Proteobacteria bacterium]|nr:hypothetical protein [Pseudomonadota bacterium]